MAREIARLGGGQGVPGLFDASAVIEPLAWGLVGGLYSWLGGRRQLVTPDEAWFLVVIRRLIGRDRLYGDVFFGVGPLSVWTARLVTRVAGVEARVLRVMNSICFAILCVACDHLLRIAECPGLLRACVLAAIVGASGPARWPQTYGELARTASVVGVALVVDWLGGDGGSGAAQVQLLLAGAVVAIAILTQHNIGGVAASATLLMAATSGRPALATLNLAVGGLLVSLPAALLVVGSCSVDQMYRMTLRNKTNYLGSARIGMWTGFQRAARQFVGRSDQGRIGRVTLGLVGVALDYSVIGAAGLCAMLAGAVSIGGGSERHVVLAVVALGAITLASGAFRADLPHVQSSDSISALVCGLALSLASRPWPLAGFLGAAALGSYAAISVACLAGSRSSEGMHTGLPHLRGVPVERVTVEELAVTAKELRAATGGKALILRPDAAFWYLTAGVRNPTPYDYPLSSTFGPNGQEKVTKAIDEGEFDWVWLLPETGGAMAPEILINHVTNHMRVVGQIGRGQLYGCDSRHN